MTGALSQPGVAERQGAPDPTPLVVDLDGTLISSDLLIETFLALVSTHPVRAARSLAHLLQGRAEFKAHLADYGLVDELRVPVNDAVVEHLNREKSLGRRIFLVTASDSRLAKAIAKRFGVFEEAIGSEGPVNLSGAAKAEMLIGRFGEGGFDYIGNSRADLSVWKGARRRIAVNAPAGVLRSLKRLDPAAEILGPPFGSGWPKALAKALRPHQWAKNALVFLPLVAGHRFDLAAVAPAVAGFVALCLLASSAYLLNDLLDLQHDRTHRSKRHRPIASGKAPLLLTACLVPALAITAIALAAVTSLGLLLAVLTYYAGTIIYSVKIKRLLLIDIFALSFLYCIRVIVGSVASGISLSPWLVSFCLFLFLGLATIKRLTELIGLEASGQKISGRAYQHSDIQPLAALATASAFSAAIVLSLYINSPITSELYTRPTLLWPICPIFLYWNIRIILLAMRDKIHDDPLVFALTDRTSMFVAAACGLALLAAGLS